MSLKDVEFTYFFCCVFAQYKTKYTNQGRNNTLVRLLQIGLLCMCV